MTKNVVAIGNFDGVHVGHQALLAQAASLGQLTVLTFEPHPKQFFTPTPNPFLLSTLPTRQALLQQHGADCVLVKPFDAAFATLSPQDFMQHILHTELGTHTLVVGPNFRFGANRAGDVSLLQQSGFNVVSPALLADDRAVITSTRIRAALQQGDVAQANQLLGRPWVVQGLVQQGAQLARTLGFPTANVPWPADIIVPKLGVYAGLAVLPNGQTFNAVANIGTRPTVNNGQDVRLEVHIFDFNEDLYGKSINFVLQQFVRAEQAFESVLALQAQITQDILYARQLHQSK